MILLFTPSAIITLNFSTFEQLYNAIEDGKRLNVENIRYTTNSHMAMARQKEL